MTTVTEAEVTAVHAPGTEIAAYSAPGAIEYRAQFVMEPAEARALDDQLRECMRAVLRENVDYGTIPGMGDRPALFKPGAEKLLQWFGFGHTMERTDTERDADGQRMGITYRCTVIKGLAGQTVVVASCEGYAGYDEDKYYTSVEDATAKEQANARKYHRDVNPLKCREYRAPWNTLMKMAEKRALVGAAIQATAASGLFTQDIEDMAPPVPDEGAKFRAAAMKALMALDEPVRKGVGDWYRGKRWPDPREWDPEQWCMALEAAGFIAGEAMERARHAAAAPDPAAAPASADGADEPAQPAAAEVAWYDATILKAASFQSEAEGGNLFREAAAAARDGRCTPGEATHIQNLINARIDDRRKELSDAILSEVSEGDEWRLTVEALSEVGEARNRLEEVQGLSAAGQMDADRADLLGRAIIARFPKAAVKDLKAPAKAEAA